MSLLLLTLIVVPIAARHLATRHTPRHSAALTGIAFGSVASPFSLGLYIGAFFLGPFGLPLVAIGLPASIFHGTPGFRIAVELSVIPPGVVEGISRLYVELLNALVWAPIYGALGWLVDRVRKPKTAQSAL
jgi:hypothetical protein